MVTQKIPTKRELASLQKRELIFEKSLELFSKYGYDNTTMEDISKATGMSIGSIYHFFKNKQGILQRVTLKVFSDSKKYLDIESNSIDNPCDSIIRYFQQIAHNFDEVGKDITRCLHDQYSSLWKEPDCDNDACQYSSSTSNSFTIFIEKCQELGKFDRSIDALKASEYIYIVVDGIIGSWAFQDNARSLYDSITEFLPRALISFQIDNIQKDIQQKSDL